MAGGVRAAAARGPARAARAARAGSKDANPYTRAFAVKGLGALKDRAAVPALLPLVDRSDRAVAIEAIRALGRIGDPAAAPPLLKLVADAEGRTACCGSKR